MPRKVLLDKMSIYIPQRSLEKRPVERLIQIADQKDRSVNYVTMEAILQYLEREERKIKN